MTRSSSVDSDCSGARPQTASKTATSRRWSSGPESSRTARPSAPAARSAAASASATAVASATSLESHPIILPFGPVRGKHPPQWPHGADGTGGPDGPGRGAQPWRGLGTSTPASGTSNGGTTKPWQKRFVGSSALLSVRSRCQEAAPAALAVRDAFSAPSVKFR